MSIYVHSVHYIDSPFCRIFRNFFSTPHLFFYLSNEIENINYQSKKKISQHAARRTLNLPNANEKIDLKKKMVR